MKIVMEYGIILELFPYSKNSRYDTAHCFKNNKPLYCNVFQMIQGLFHELLEIKVSVYYKNVLNKMGKYKIIIVPK